MAIFRRGPSSPPLTGASNAGGDWKKTAIFYQYLASSRVVNGATVNCYKLHTAAPDRGMLVTLIARRIMRRRLLIAGDGRRSSYGKKPQRYASDII